MKLPPAHEHRPRDVALDDLWTEERNSARMSARRRHKPLAQTRRRPGSLSLLDAPTLECLQLLPRKERPENRQCAAVCVDRQWHSRRKLRSLSVRRIWRSRALRTCSASRLLKMKMPLVCGHR